MGKPPTSWSDDIARLMGSRWRRMAYGRVDWRNKEAFAQQWVDVGPSDDQLSLVYSHLFHCHLGHKVFKAHYW